MWRLFSIFIICFSISGAAFAQSPQTVSDIRIMLDSGQYVEAGQEAESLQTAEGYALAAEALNGQVLLGEVKDLNDTAKAALELSEKALSLDPNSKNARLQEALAFGFVTRTTGDFKAWRKKLPQKTYNIVFALREDYPDDARATALLAAWHLGVIRAVGVKNGGKWFGASLEEGKNLYRLAQQSAPHDILIATNYYMSLHVLDLEFHEAHNQTDLENILRLRAATDVEKKVQAQAKVMLGILGDREAEVELAENFLDGEWD